jgi:hypothetical protein
MKVFARRVPCAWSLLLVALLFGGLASYGLATGEAYLPPGKRSPARHVSEKKDPKEYRRLIRYEFGVAAVFAAISLVRVVPVEDFFAGLHRSLATRAKNDRTPAPWWAYAFLAGFIALVIWIGWKVMYSG